MTARTANTNKGRMLWQKRHDISYTTRKVFFTRKDRRKRGEKRRKNEELRADPGTARWNQSRRRPACWTLFGPHFSKWLRGSRPSPSQSPPTHAPPQYGEKSPHGQLLHRPPVQSLSSQRRQAILDLVLNGVHTGVQCRCLSHQFELQTDDRRR